MKSIYRALSLLFVCLLCFVSCGGKKMQVPREVSSVAVSIPYAFSESPNPYYATEKGDLAILSLITERYFTTPGVASIEQKATDDGLVRVTVTVKDRARFSNGKRASASDLLHAIYLVCDPSYDGPYGALRSSSLVGLERFRTGEVATIEGVKRVNTYACELTFSSEEPYEELLDLPVVNSGEYGAVVFGKCSSDDFIATYAKVIGTGPYAVNERLEDSPGSIGLTKNKAFGGSSSAHSDVTVFFVPDEDVGVNLQMDQLQAGIVTDEASAKAQSKRCGCKLYALSDGYLLCDRDVKTVTDTYHTVDFLIVLLTQL